MQWPSSIQKRPDNAIDAGILGLLELYLKVIKTSIAL